MSHQNQKMGDPLEHFVNRLIKEKGMTDIEGEYLEQIRADLLDRVETRVNMAILEHMPPEKLEYFEKLLDRSDSVEIQDFCRRNIYGLDELIANELLEFRKTYLNLE